MTRHQTCWALLTALVLLPGQLGWAAETPDITGRDTCEGTNPDGKTYKGQVVIACEGDTYHVKWALAGGDNYEGLGILEGNVLAVSYSGTIAGVIVYQGLRVTASPICRRHAGFLRENWGPRQR